MEKTMGPFFDKKGEYKGLMMIIGRWGHKMFGAYKGYNTGFNFGLTKLYQGVVGN